MVKKTKKPAKVLAGSHKASPACAVAIRELLKVQEKQALLTKKAKLLRNKIMAEGAGSAHGVRIYISHVRGGTYTVKRKACDRLVIIKGAK